MSAVSSTKAWQKRLASPSAGVALGIRAIREETQRSLMHPRRDAIGRRPDLPITDDGPVECRLLSPTAVVDPCSDAASGRLVLYPAPDFRLVKALQDALQSRRR